MTPGIPLRALILEDNPEDAEILVHELCRAGFEVEWQRVDTEAAYLAQLSPDLDIIFADYMLPQFDGLRALEIFQQRRLDIPYIIVSGSIGEDLAVAAMKQGAWGYLLKDRLGRLGQATLQALKKKRLQDEQQRAEAALKAREEQFQLLASHIPQVFWMTNAEQTWPFYVSPAYEKVWGRPLAELKSDPRAWLEAIHPQDRERVIAAMNSLPKGPYDIEYRILRPDRTTRWVHDRAFPITDEQGHIHCIAGVAEDITERKRAQESLARLVAILEATPDLVAMADHAGRILYLNRAGRKMVEVGEREDLSQTVLSNYYPPEVYEFLVSQAVPTAIDKGTWSGETRLLSRSGQEIPISQVILAHKAAHGELKYLSTISRDITERKLYEERIARLSRIHAVLSGINSLILPGSATARSYCKRPATSRSTRASSGWPGSAGWRKPRWTSNRSLGQVSMKLS